MAGFSGKVEGQINSNWFSRWMENFVTQKSSVTILVVLTNGDESHGIPIHKTSPNKQIPDNIDNKL